jgi:molecular chaperone DnaJ
MSKDYYKILGIGKSASQDDVKRAFRELAHKHHPDKAGGDAEKFKEINEAYQVIGNAEKRKQYDQFGTTFDNAGFGGGGAGGPFGGFGGFSQGAGGFNINMEDLDLGDVFGNMFGMGGGGRKTTRKNRGKDIEMTLTISFKESVLGAEKVIELYKNSKCDTCNGTGAEPGSRINICKECEGTGKVSRVQQTMLGAFKTVTPCTACSGEGKTPEKFCKDCRGTGAKKKSVNLKINVPAGINDGEILRIMGSGEAGGRGNASGDLYLHVAVSADKRFERSGDNILVKAPLDFKTAVLGGDMEVETLDGKMKIKIPEGTESGQVFRLRGKGVAGRGDMLVETFITVPQKLSKKQRKILEEWEE